jgi:hypothetical protein
LREATADDPGAEKSSLEAKLSFFPEHRSASRALTKEVVDYFLSNERKRIVFEGGHGVPTWTIYYPVLASSEEPLPRRLPLFIEEVAQAEPADIERRLIAEFLARFNNGISRGITANFELSKSSKHGFLSSLCAWAGRINSAPAGMT